MNEVRDFGLSRWKRRAIGHHASVTGNGLVVLLVLAAASPWRAAERHAGPASWVTRHAGQQPVQRQWIEMRNVDLGVSDSVTVRVQSLRGEVLRTEAMRPATLDDPRSFRIRVTAGRVAMTGADLAGVLNSVVFAYPGAPLRDLQVRTDGQQIIQTGVLHKGVDLRFRLRGVLSLMPDGRVRIHPTSVRVLGFNGERVLAMVGLHLDNLLDLRGAHGASVKGDDLFLDPLAILPPPAITGRLATIGIEGDRVAETFVQEPDDSAFPRSSRADSAGPGFVYFRGGQLRFGKLLMNDADLRIMDDDRGASFALSLPHYSDQLVAGTSRLLRNQGLVVSMPDYDRLQAMKNGRSGVSAPTPSRQDK